MICPRTHSRSDLRAQGYFVTRTPLLYSSRKKGTRWALEQETPSEIQKGVSLPMTLEIALRKGEAQDGVIVLSNGR